MNAWVSATEEPPATDEDVLCCDAISHNDIWIGRRGDEGQWYTQDEWTHRTPTHWMELPPMPEHAP